MNYQYMVFGAALALISHTVEAELISPLPDPLEAGWNGEAVCEKLQEDNSQRVLRCTFPPKVGHEKHFHVAHFGYALSGGKMRIEDESGVREVELKTGSSYSSSGTKWHKVLNVGTSTVRYLIIERLEQSVTTRKNP